MRSSPRILLFLNGNRGLELYKELVKQGISIVGLVSNNKTGIFDATVPVLTLNNKNWTKLTKFIASKEPDLGIVAGFSHILPNDVLKVPKYGFWNLHAGSVPEYRGGSPLNWQLINGEDQVGLSILKMTPGIDDGPVLSSTKFKLSNMDTILDLHMRANQLFPLMLLPLLSNLPKSLRNAKVQSHYGAKYWHQRNERDGQIDWKNSNSQQVYNFVRALSKPYPGAFGVITGRREVRIWKVKIDENHVDGVPGRIVKLKDGFHVPCGGGGSVLLLEFESRHPFKNGERFKSLSS
jgi:methionyl-tRNA formyltransferase